MQQVTIAGGQPLDPALATAIADEMVELTARLGALAYDLGSERETLRRHVEALQDIDLITQTQLLLADLLRTPRSIDDSLGAISLQALADRMRHRLLPGAAAD